MQPVSSYGNPQKEDGFTPIANELLEAILKADFSKRQMLVVMTIIRMTYGYSKKSDALSGWQISSMTGIDRSDVSKTISELIKLNVITKYENGRESHGIFVNEIAINKHYKSWLTVGDLPTVVKLPTVGKTPTVTVGDLPIEPLVKHPTHKEIQNKEKKYISKNKKITFFEYLEKCKSEGRKPINPDDHVFEYANKANIPDSFLEIAWLTFKNNDYYKKAKYIDWPKTFENFVKQNRGRLWWLDASDNTYKLTTVGMQQQNYFKNNGDLHG